MVMLGLHFKRESGDPQFQIQIDGEEVGILNGVFEGREVRLVHTEIDTDDLENEVADELINFAIDTMKDFDFKIVAVCPIVIGFLHRHPRKRAALLAQYRLTLP